MNNGSRTILVVTDEDESLVLEFVDLYDLQNERILPGNTGLPSDQ
jgi:hypothetical protein